MQLWLRYTNENGVAQRVLVNAEKYSIGRHSENDLCIPKNQLSRRHAEIDRYEDVFVIADNNSSNGTTLNGKNLERPTALKNGDKIDLGGGVEITAELISDAPTSRDLSAAESSDVDSSYEESAEKAETEARSETESVAAVKLTDFPAAVAGGTAAPASSGIGIFLILAGVMVLAILLFGVLILFLTRDPKSTDGAQNSGKGGYSYPDDDDENLSGKNKNNADKNENSGQKNSNDKSPVNSSTPFVSFSGNSMPSPAPPVSSEFDAIERNALSFLRRIAKTDPNPVLKQRQIEIIKSSIKSVKGAAGLKDNLQGVKKNSAQIETLAKSKNLRPQFLATAALAKIGNARGDVLAVAQSIAGDLNQLSNLIANDTSDDSLMIIAAFSDGGAADKSRMPSMLANLTKNSPSEVRQIRTIWFLRDNGKITEAQYQFALRFLAIGTIMQSPKDFSVEAEAVIFN